ncbi:MULTISPECIES: LysR substrate-binding domain-containing protein [Ramlibacter]|uniref:LysR family transcriptional regulator n=1 Tax=Ramlibacter pinisoli TaxID=2682844 RepID=A0A6N8IYS9_9BURK|nr:MULTISPECIES: LysR substrate-binding domain-containing protein [Ramlibacter]MBA2962044.1 LysR family transcriptional regulator [Ramlibacter sp. CGMCC 1.13660]MVQ31987.1 LysR family transcriptional regulator [Ramlibacter pinisoli]
MQPTHANTSTAEATLPRSRQLRLDLLQAFEAAARHLSFTRAGTELALSQPAISRQIQQLEASLGTPLFERRHRALVLTEAGRVMQRAVDDSLERLRDAAARVRGSAAPSQVAITCTPGFASFWLIPRLPRFTAAFPAVDVRISASLAIVDLERSDVDFAVRFVPIEQGRGPRLFEEEVQPMCAPSLLRDRSRPLRSPADLVEQTLLTIDMTGAPLTVDWEPWFQLMGLRDVRMAHTMRFTHYTEAVAAAVAGQGVVIGRLPLLADLVRRKQLVAPFRTPAASRRGYFLTPAPRAARNPHALDFMRWLQSEAEQAQAGADPATTPRR